MEIKEAAILPESWSPLHDAVLIEDVVKVKNCLEEGKNVNVENSNKETPLHIAAYSKQLNIVKMLIDAGADLSAEDNEQRTPLDVAKDTNEDGSHNAIIALLRK